MVFLAASVGMLYLAGMALAPLKGMRDDYQLTSEPVEGVSPQLALATQVLGWGRGLIIDVLWIRMEMLKEEGKFFELVQLADWACKLAPRFPQVWDIQSWNLAFNVPTKIDELPDRWPWVRAGIELLRDEGIPNNRNAPMLYDRLAWFYSYKIGEQDDNAHFFYKQHFGLLMHEVLGGEGAKDALEAFIRAPRTREGLLKDEEVKRFVDLCAARGFDIVDGFFELYTGAKSVPEGVKEVARRPDCFDALRKVAAFARAAKLRTEYKLDPERMLALREQYGPFDWRSPYPHCIYWATLGLEKLDEVERKTVGAYKDVGKDMPSKFDLTKEPWREGEGFFDFERVNLQRRIYGAMQSLCMHGRLLFDTRGRLMLEVGPDYRFAEATLPIFDMVLQAHGQRFKLGTEEGLKNFLRRGILEFYFMGDVKRARDYFDRLGKRFPEDIGGLTLEQYIHDRFLYYTREVNASEARTLIRNYLIQAFFALGCNADEKAAIYEMQAKLFAETYNADAIKTLRNMVRLDSVKEGVVVDMLTGTLRLHPTVAANLRRRLEESKDGLVQTILEKLKASKQALPVYEEVAEPWLFDRYYNPS
jgi:hypothetical protein